MTIRKKMLGMVMFFMFIAVAIGAGGGYGLFRTGNTIDHIVRENIPLSDKINNLEVIVTGARVYEKEFFLFSEVRVPEKMEKYYKQAMEKFENVKAGLSELKTGNEQTESVEAEGGGHESHRMEIVTVVGEIEEILAKTTASFQELADRLMKGERFIEAQDAYVPYRTNIRDLTNKIAELKENVLKETEQVSSEAMVLQKQLLSAFLVAAAVMLLFGAFLGFVFNRQVSSGLSSLMKGITAISSGEMAVLPVKTKDEFGKIAKVFNETMDKLKVYIQTDEERRMTQENIMKFMDVLSTASEGDFTQKAPVTADVFGSVADAFNMMMDELAALIREVRATANEIGKDSSDTLSLLKNMAKGSESQMVQLKSANEAIEETSQATITISTKTEDATKISALAEQASRKGEQLVAKSIEGMQVIRAAVQVINKKMKMFSERVIEIGTISSFIADIATRTNLLSMNASIEASRAGDAGKGFMVIAEEIRNLADRSANATTDITNIIRSIQTEAGEITSSLEDETEIVEKQSVLASEIKAAFSEIKNAVDESKGIVLEILPLSETQRKTTDNIILSMENVNHISLDLLKLVQDSENISEKLSVSSRALFTSVEKFRLPAPGSNGRDAGTDSSPVAVEAHTVIENDNLADIDKAGA